MSTVCSPSPPADLRTGPQYRANRVFVYFLKMSSAVANNYSKYEQSNACVCAICDDDDLDQLAP